MGWECWASRARLVEVEVELRAGQEITTEGVGAETGEAGGGVDLETGTAGAEAVVEIGEDQEAEIGGDEVEAEGDPGVRKEVALDLKMGKGNLTEVSLIRR